MANDVTIRVKTKGTKEAKKAFGDAAGGADLLKKAALGLGAAVGARQLGRAISSAVNRAEEMASAYAITDQIVKQTGGSANLTAQEIKNLSREQSLLTGVDKKLVTEGNNVLLTFKNLRDEVGAGNDVYSRTSAAMLDMAAVMGTDAKAAAIQLGKALNDPIANLGALGRAGVQFSEEQTKAIKTMAGSGELLGAQKIILAELESQFGGTAEASADATAKIGNAFKEMSEQVGEAILPLVDNAVPVIVGLADSMRNAAINFKVNTGNIRRDLAGLKNVADALLTPFINLEEAWDDQQESLFQVERRLASYFDLIREGIAPSDAFATAFIRIQAAGEAYDTTLKNLIATTGIADDELRAALLDLHAHAEAYGLTATQVDLLERALFDLDNQVTVITPDLVTLGGAADEAAKDFGTLVKSTGALWREQRKLIDPVFRAQAAFEDLEEAAEKAAEDSVITAEEIAEIAPLYAEWQAAQNELTTENLEAYNDVLGATGDFLDAVPGKVETARESVGEFAPALDEMRRAFDELTDKKLLVEFRLDLPTRSEMDALVAGALGRINRNRPGLLPEGAS